MTEHEDLRYEDDRFDWQYLAEPPLAVHWVDGDLAFGQNALDAGASGIDRIRSLLFLQPGREIDIYLYPNTRDLETGLARTGRDWTAGHSDPALSVILLPVAAGPESALEFERLIPHELTHLLLYERMGEAYSRLPTWLNEGLATNMELSPDPRYRASLEQAAATGEWLTWDSLCGAVPSSGSEALLVYAQSASLVSYLRDVYGAGSILALLDAYQEGASCTGAVQRILRRSPVELLREWQDFWKRSEAEPSPGIRTYGWLILAVLGTVGVVVGVFVWRKRRGSGLRGPPDSGEGAGPDS